jgi:hypothetical protein
MMMTFPKTLTKSPTLELSIEQRERLIELVADRYLDQMDLRDLETFFLETQAQYLEDYSDQELLSEVEDLTSDFEYEEIINELG